MYTCHGNYEFTKSTRGESSWTGLQLDSALDLPAGLQQSSPILRPHTLVPAGPLSLLLPSAESFQSLHDRLFFSQTLRCCYLIIACGAQGAPLFLSGPLNLMSSTPLPADPKHKGTLACVVLKAKNLPNKRSIGKQDPFAVLSIGAEKQKTKPDKRGGQHPTWDEQLHFEIYDDVEDVIRDKAQPPGSAEGSQTSTPTGTVTSNSSSKLSSASAGVASATPVKKSSSAGGKKVLKVACYADDNREPEFIGEGLVDLTGVLKTGEFDEWVTIRSKDRYAGEVYLELTFFSSAPRPRRTKKTKPAQAQDSSYGGAGTFTAEVDESDFDSGSGPRPPAKGNQHPRIPSSMMPDGAMQHHARMSTSASVATLSSRPYAGQNSAGRSLDDIPPTLRPSSSLAGISTYTPPYAPQTIHRASSPGLVGHPAMPSSNTMHGFEDHVRRESLPTAYSRPDLSSTYSSHTSTYGRDNPEPAYGGNSHLSHSYSTSSVASIGTIRPASAQPLHYPHTGPPEDPIQDLIRPMSSMSFAAHAAARPASAAGAPISSAYHTASGSAAASDHTNPSQPHYSSAPQGQWEHAGSRVPSQAYAVPQGAASSVAPTPPPHPNSAPPTLPYAAPSQGNYPDHLAQARPVSPYYQPPVPHQPMPPPAPQVHPAQTFVPTQGSMSNLSGIAHSQQVPSAYPTQRAPSPQPPPRPLSTGGYHALPPLPPAHSYAPAGHAVPDGPSPPPRSQPLPTPPGAVPPGPPPQQGSYGSGTVVNAQSLYHPPAPAHTSSGYEGARAASPIPPPRSSFSHPGPVDYQHAYQLPPSHASPAPQHGSRPLPQLTPLGAQPGSATSYFPQATSQSAHSHQTYDHHTAGIAPHAEQHYSGHAPAAHAASYSQQPTYIPSPYEQHNQAQQQSAAPTPVDQYHGHQQPLPHTQQHHGGSMYAQATQPPPPPPPQHAHYQYAPGAPQAAEYSYHGTQ
ncbi:unnamed protein product [Parajaminaea phylloscopi]